MNRMTMDKESFVAQLPSVFSMEGELLYDDRNTIKLFTMDDGAEIVVKRFKRPNIVQKVAYTFFRPTKARRAFIHGRELTSRGIVTPEPYGYAETKRMGLIDYCYFASSRTSGRPIEDYLYRDDWDRQLAELFARYAAYLHMKGVLHHDLNDTNVLYDTEWFGDGGYCGPEPFECCNVSRMFSVIDTNRMKFYPEGQEIPLGECLLNLSRFTKRMDLFEFVLHKYAEYRHLDADTLVREGLAVKSRFDSRRRRKKTFLARLKRLVGIGG